MNTTTYVWLRSGSRLSGKWDIKTDAKSCKQFVEVGGTHLLDPLSDLTKIPTETIEKITYKTVIYEHSRKEGLYVRGEVDLLVKNTWGGSGRSKFGVSMGMPIAQQEIRIKGPDAKSVWSMYLDVLEGKLEPSLPLTKELLDKTQP